MFTLEQIDGIAARLKEAPAMPRALTTHEAIKRLAPSIRAMQARGYNLDQVADTLKHEGLVVSGKTLARHLRAQKTVAGDKKPSSAAPVGNAARAAAGTDRAHLLPNPSPQQPE
ncbi:MAG: hypothetical protein Q8Q28_03380 [Pseudomonadota bacterium]|nr:hypothetical protein [Pseudomonadota bacterium]